MTMPVGRVSDGREKIDLSTAAQRGQHTENNVQDKVQTLADQIPVQTRESLNNKLAKERANDITKETQAVAQVSTSHVRSKPKREREEITKGVHEKRTKKQHKEPSHEPSVKHDEHSRIALQPSQSNPPKPAQPAFVPAPAKENINKSQAETRQKANEPTSHEPPVQHSERLLPKSTLSAFVPAPAKENINKSEAIIRQKAKEAECPELFPIVQTSASPTAAMGYESRPFPVLIDMHSSHQPVVHAYPEELIDLTKSINISNATVQKPSEFVSKPAVYSAPVGLAAAPQAPASATQPVFSAPIGLAATSQAPVSSTPIIPASPTPPVFSAPIGLATMHQVPVSTTPPVFSAPIGLAAANPATVQRPIAHVQQTQVIHPAQLPPINLTKHFSNPVRRDEAAERKKHKNKYTVINNDREKLNKGEAQQRQQMQAPTSGTTSPKVDIKQNVKSINHKNNSCCYSVARFITVALTVAGIAAIITGIVLYLPIVIGAGAAVSAVSLPIFLILSWKAGQRRRLMAA